MAFLHVFATLPGGARKVISNKSEADVLSGFVVPFIKDGTITTTWGSKTQTRQALELRIFQTETPFAPKAGIDRDAFGEPPPDTWVSEDPARCRKPTCRR
ncbi:MAG TPA: hypothetical protein VFC52_02845 [Solirubrobacterales bacterium]|nr:hypothetical protein [Solirubrobacterales bacterium]